MYENTYIDFQIVADAGDEFVVLLEKDLLNKLVKIPGLKIRHWDGEKPVSLVAYGDTSVRTLGDDSEENNLTELPHVNSTDFKKMLKTS